MSDGISSLAGSKAPAQEFSCFYRLIWHSARAFFQVLGNAEVAGLENIPRTGAFLLAANHASFLDPPFVGCYLSRPICSFARKTLWKPGPMSWVLDHLKCIPVNRDGEGDVAGFKRVIAALKAGEVVQIFPEGTRTRDGRLQPARRGVGMLASRLGVPIVPARIFGTYEILSRDHWLPRPGYRLGITYGRLLTPAEFDPGPDDPQRQETIAALVMDKIAALPPPWTTSLQS